MSKLASVVAWNPAPPPAPERCVWASEAPAYADWGGRAFRVDGSSRHQTWTRWGSAYLSSPGKESGARPDSKNGEDSGQPLPTATRAPGSPT